MTPKKPEVTVLPGFNRDVPVRLFSGTRAEIGVDGLAALECYRSGQLSEVYYFSSEFVLEYDSTGIRVSDQNGALTDGLSEVRCKPRNEISFCSFSGRFYRGYLKAINRIDNGEFLLVNIVDLEEYLSGVLPAEIGERSQSEYEAAKAQAVAARTYAVWKLTNGAADEMLFPTIADQVYAGKNAEIDLLTKAVYETAGEIITINHLPIAAFYHAVCGGKTIPVEKAWPDRKRTSYLQGTDDDDYCAWAKNYEWIETFSDSTIKSNLIRYFSAKDIGVYDSLNTILDIEFFVDDQTGRAALMQITTDMAVYDIKYDQIRWALGKPSAPQGILPSTLFIADVARGQDQRITMVLRGKGNGHGVGVCQCGAIGRAREGQKYDKILKTYYKGVKIERLY